VGARSPEGQPCPGLHHKQHGQQVEGGGSAPLLCSGETPAEVLCPALGPSAQERHGPVGACPEEGHKNGQRAGTPLLPGKLGLFSLQKRRLHRDLIAAFLYLKAAYEKAGEGLLTRACSDRKKE